MRIYIFSTWVRNDVVQPFMHAYMMKENTKQMDLEKIKDHRARMGEEHFLVYTRK